jgi:hypothetical protein
VLRGGYRLVEPPADLAGAPTVVIAACGAVVPEAVHAARALADEGIAATVIDMSPPTGCIASGAPSCAQRAEEARHAHVAATQLGQLIPAGERSAPIVTVHDAASHALAWLGSVFGQRVDPGRRRRVRPIGLDRRSLPPLRPAPRPDRERGPGCRRPRRDGPMIAPDTEDLEAWFLKRGVPHFIVDYSARTDIWTRALPILVLAYFLVGLNALDIREQSAGWNLAVAALVVAVLLTTWVIANRVRGRPLFTVPTEVGPAELAVFVLGPMVPPLLLGQYGDGFQAFVQGVAVLGTIYLATSYAIVPLFRWASRRSASQVALFFNTVVRVLPLLLLVITFLFVNAEVWQVAGRLRGWPYVVVVGLFVALGVLFVLSRVPGLINGLAAFDDWESVTELVAGTPADAWDRPVGPVAVAPLDARERLNLALVTIFNQALQITFVAITVYVFFVLLGWLAIPPDTVAVWIAGEPNELAGSGRLAVTEELLRVAGFLAAFTGMYFTVVLSTDATYREEFAEDVAPQIRQALAVRAVYLVALRRGA